MTNSLIRSNRQSRDKFKPSQVATVESIQEEHSTSTIQSVTFDTNLKITNHSRNKLQAMSVLGYAASQKVCIDIAFQAFYDSLSSEEQKEINIQVHTLEKRDVKTLKRRSN